MLIIHYLAEKSVCKGVCAEIQPTTFSSEDLTTRPAVEYDKYAIRKLLLVFLISFIYFRFLIRILRTETVGSKRQ